MTSAAAFHPTTSSAAIAAATAPAPEAFASSSAAAAAEPGVCPLARFAAGAASTMSALAVDQGLPLVHISAQRKHFLGDTFGACFSPSPLDRGTRGGVTKRA